MKNRRIPFIALPLIQIPGKQLLNIEPWSTKVNRIHYVSPDGELKNFYYKTKIYSKTLRNAENLGDLDAN